MNISVLGLLFTLLLLIIPIYIIYRFKLGLMQRFGISVFRMTISVAFMAVIVWAAIALKSIVYNIVMSIVLIMVSTIFTLGRTKLNTSKLFVPVIIGTFVGVVIVGFYCFFLVFGLSNPLTSSIFVPFIGIIAGSLISVNAKALQTYYTGLQHHDQLYNYLLGNGATHLEALRFFMRRCIQSSIVSVSKEMSRTVFLTAPVLLFGLVMGGVDIFTAAIFQVLFFVAVMSASLISLLVVLYVGRKYSFDDYDRLKPVVKTSSSPSKLHDTDSENQQPVESPETHPAE